MLIRDALAIHKIKKLEHEVTEIYLQKIWKEEQYVHFFFKFICCKNGLVTKINSKLFEVIKEVEAKCPIQVYSSTEGILMCKNS